VDVSWDRSHTVVGLAGHRDDGLAHIEVIATRAGTDWLSTWLRSSDRSPDVLAAPVAVQARGAPVSSLIPEMRDAGVPVVEWGGVDLGVATGEFYDRVRAAIGEGSSAAQLRHRNQPLLNIAAATASTRPVQDAWLWDRRHSPTDVSPLIAVTGALWALGHAQPRTSVYETRRLEVL
jgi:aryl-alcohol dehydrogenase-like predicted oxidoreductase